MKIAILDASSQPSASSPGSHRCKQNGFDFLQIMRLILIYSTIDLLLSETENMCVVLVFI